MSLFHSLRHKAANYYTQKIRAHGPSPQGVDWNGETSQRVRFEQLCKVISEAQDEAFSILDYGCGYGALVSFLRQRYKNFCYTGFDISEEMVKQAELLYPSYRFLSDDKMLTTHGYVVASGVFNVKLDTPIQDWEDYVKTTLHQIDSLSHKGFAFNILTSYSDPDRMKDYLYYADPCMYFDYCKRNFSKWVALLHDYGLWEFTILVRKF